MAQEMKDIFKLDMDYCIISTYSHTAYRSFSSLLCLDFAWPKGLSFQTICTTGTYCFVWRGKTTFRTSRQTYYGKVEMTTFFVIFLRLEDKHKRGTGTTTRSYVQQHEHSTLHSVPCPFLPFQREHRVL